MKIGKQLFCMLLLLSVLCQMKANATKVWDFEDCEIGQEFKMWNLFGSEASTSSAVVEADPKNPNNKVLHVKVRE